MVFFTLFSVIYSAFSALILLSSSDSSPQVFDPFRLSVTQAFCRAFLHRRLKSMSCLRERCDKFQDRTVSPNPSWVSKFEFNLDEMERVSNLAKQALNTYNQQEEPDCIAFPSDSGENYVGPLSESKEHHSPCTCNKRARIEKDLGDDSAVGFVDVNYGSFDVSGGVNVGLMAGSDVA